MANFYLPIAGISAGQLSDTFGAPRSGGRSHKGIDIFANTGAPVVAVRSGTVVKAGSAGLGGKRVWVRDGEGLYHYYAHLDSIGVEEGQTVEAGQRLGGVGNTGNAAGTDPHLHYSVNPSSASSEQGSLNPYEYLTGGGAQPSSPDALSETGRAGTVSTEQIEDEGVDAAVASATGETEQSPTLSEVTPSQSEFFATMMSHVSKRASESGGKVLDVRALFGDIFADEQEDDESDSDVMGGVV